MIYRLEAFETAYRDAKPLVLAHYKEIAHYQDIQLNPDEEKYQNLENLGMLKTFTARTEDGELLGYQCFVIVKNMHYKDSVQALEDVLFVSKNRRGFGHRFIKWSDEQLRAMGVQVVYRHVKKAHNHGRILERFGYENVDLIFAKRLDK